MVIGDSERSAPTEARRKAILEAALSCFASKGFTETTMEDIRKLSGASTGSIYHHFANKEMLARALYLEGRSSLNAALFASIATNDLRTGIKALVCAYLDWFEQHADLGQYVMQAGNSEYLGAYVKVLRQFSDSHRQQRTHEVVDIARHGGKNRDAITSVICIQLISKIICNLRSIEWKIRDPTRTDDMIHRVAKPPSWCGGWLVSAKLSEADYITPKAEIATFP